MQDNADDASQRNKENEGKNSRTEQKSALASFGNGSRGGMPHMALSRRAKRGNLLIANSGIYCKQTNKHIIGLAAHKYMYSLPPPLYIENTYVDFQVVCIELTPFRSF